MGQILFGKDQQLAIQVATDWMFTKSYKHPIFVIGGYAGTGKSTVLNQVLANIGILPYKVAFMTYTGKAAIILRRKGLNAITIHKAIYNTSMGSGGKPLFRKKPRLPGNIDLICVDELGMVPNQLMQDILSFGIPVLALGDPGQLPPIYGENDYIVKPDVFLYEVYRNSGGILNYATDIRNGEPLYSSKDYGTDVQIIGLNELAPESMLKYDQILCGTNNTKSTINVKIRNIRGEKTPLPSEGEKVICQANNFKDSIPGDNGVEMFMVNGMTGITTTDTFHINEDTIMFGFNPDFSTVKPQIYAKRKEFEDNYTVMTRNKGEDAEEPYIIEFYDGKVVNSFDYGYAITVHKSQGSEWGRVLLFDDCFYRDEASYRRWMYTAVTRAKSGITIVKRGV